MSKFSMLNGNNVLGGDSTTQESWDKFTLAYRKHYWQRDGNVTCDGCGKLFLTPDYTVRLCPECLVEEAK